MTVTSLAVEVVLFTGLDPDWRGRSSILQVQVLRIEGRTGRSASDGPISNKYERE